jgi:hypothetical protein
MTEVTVGGVVIDLSVKTDAELQVMLDRVCVSRVPDDPVRKEVEAEAKRREARAVTESGVVFSKDDGSVEHFRV